MKVLLLLILLLQRLDVVYADALGDADKSNVFSRSSNATWWQPKASDNLSWQWQLSGTIDTSPGSGLWPWLSRSRTANVDMFDIDLFDAPQSVIDDLHSQGKRVVCYFSAGTYEAWRSDWAVYFDFLTTDVPYDGTKAPMAGNMAEWDERWLDISQIELLKPIMTSRLQLAVQKGCDAVEPDNVDAYTNRAETGIDLTYQDQLAYNKWLATTAHSLGLSIGIKNDLDQLKDLVDDFDFAVNEQCFQYNECDAYSSTFIAVDKAVFGVEYKGSPCRFCPKADQMKMSWMKKRLSLERYRVGCDDRWTRIRCLFAF